MRTFQRPYEGTKKKGTQNSRPKTQRTKTQTVIARGARAKNVHQSAKKRLPACGAATTPNTDINPSISKRKKKSERRRTEEKEISCKSGAAISTAADGEGEEGKGSTKQRARRTEPSRLDAKAAPSNREKGENPDRGAVR